MYKKIMYLLMILVCVIVMFGCKGCKKAGSEKEFNEAIEIALENNFTIKNNSSTNGADGEVYFTKVDNEKVKIYFDSTTEVETYYYTKNGNYYKGVSNTDVFTEIKITESEYKSSRFNVFKVMEYDDFEYIDNKYVLKQEEAGKYFDVLFSDAKVFSELEGFKYENLNLSFTINEGVINSVKASVNVSYKLQSLNEMSYSRDLQFYDYSNTSVVIPE